MNLEVDRNNIPQAMQNATHDFVTAMIGDQLFGIPVLEVQDVLKLDRLTRVPLAPREVAGSLNLRGRIVTAIDLRLRLGLEACAPDQNRMSVVIDHQGELYSLIVDHVGEVLSVPAPLYEKNPPMLDPLWRAVSKGIYRLEAQLMIILDTVELLKLPGDQGELEEDD